MIRKIGKSVLMALLGITVSLVSIFIAYSYADPASVAPFVSAAEQVMQII